MTYKNIMVISVGGQRILLISRIPRKLAVGTGYDVELSEAHGTAQRDGSVVTFVRYGEKVDKPIVEGGQAGVFIVLEHLEALRYLHFFKKDGVIIVNDWRIGPITMVIEVASYLENVFDILKEMRKIVVVEAAAEAKELGAPEVFNIIALGAAARHIGFEKQNWLNVTGITVPPKTIGVSEQAFKIGYALPS